MLRDEQIFIKGCDDVELGLKRKSRLEYRLSYDDEKELQGIFFIVGGFGSSTDIRMLDFTRKKFATSLPLMVVNVFYHCFCCRKSNEEAYSAEYYITSQDVENLKKVLTQLGLAHDAKYLPSNYYHILTDLVIHQKERKIMTEGQMLRGLSYTLVPPNEDYQNYLLMPALDHILALKDINKRFKKVKTRGGGGVKSLPKIYGGGCYGGQIAHLIAKIAPWHTQGVIDIACAALPKYEMFMGREMSKGDFIYQTPHLFIDCYTQSLWTKENFTPANYQIRAILNAAHLKIQSEISRETIFVSYHSTQDEFDTAKDKQTLYEAYKELGFDATLHLFKDADDIDGKIVRDLTHGGISNDRVFKKELPKMLKKFQGKDFTAKESLISYPCGDEIFSFRDEKNTFKFEITNAKAKMGGGGVKLRLKNPQIQISSVQKIRFTRA